MNSIIPKSVKKLIQMGRVTLFDNSQNRRIGWPKALLVLRTKANSRKGHQMRVISETCEGTSVRGFWPASRSKYSPHVGKKQDRKLVAKLNS